MAGSLRFAGDHFPRAALCIGFGHLIALLLDIAL